MNLKRQLLRLGPVNRANSYLRGWQQERVAAGELAHYRAEAGRRGVRAPADEPELRRRLAERLRDRGVEPRARGRLHVFVAYYHTFWENVLPYCLAKLGRVTEFEWRSRGFDDRAPDWLSRREPMNAALLAEFRRANQEQKVDALVGYLSGNNASPELLREIARAGAVVFNICWDDKLLFRHQLRGGRWRGPAGIASAVDLNLTNAPESVIKYMVEGGLAAFLPQGAEPDWHRPDPGSFDHDVSFVGARYGWRPALINYLRRQGVKVAAFGTGWENGPLPAEDVVKLYSRSRINLGFAGVGHARRLYCLKGRDFEVPLSGGLYLTTHHPELELVYDPGREIMTYHDPGDCLRKVRWLLDHPEAAERIRGAGRERALREHTWEKRFARAFELCGLLEPEGD